MRVNDRGGFTILARSGHFHTKSVLGHHNQPRDKLPRDPEDDWRDGGVRPFVVIQALENPQPEADRAASRSPRAQVAAPNNPTLAIVRALECGRLPSPQSHMAVPESWALGWTLGWPPMKPIAFLSGDVHRPRPWSGHARDPNSGSASRGSPSNSNATGLANVPFLRHVPVAASGPMEARHRCYEVQECARLELRLRLN